MLGYHRTGRAANVEIDFLVPEILKLPRNRSLALTKNDTVTLERNKLSRSAAYDATYLLWFRPTSSNGTIFRAGDKRFALEEGKLIFYYGDQSSIVNRQIINGTWHHLVLVVNRTYNNIAVYLDNQLTVTFAADKNAVTFQRLLTMRMR